MAKIKNKKINIFAAVIAFVTAGLLALSALTMGMANMLFNEQFYANISVSDLIEQGIGNVFSSYMSSGSMLSGIIVFMIVALLFYFIVIISEKAEHIIKTAVIGSVFAFVFRALTLILWNLPQTSDFRMNYELSELISTIPIGYWGEFVHELNTQYTGTWSAHMPFIIYQSLVIKSGLSLGILNAVYGTASCVFAALAAKELFGKKAFTAALLLMALNPLEILFTPVLSNQHIAVMFFIASIWLLLRSRGYARTVLSALLMGISQIFRPEMYVAVIGAVMFYAIITVRDKNKKPVIQAVIFALTFAAVIIACDLIFRGLGLISGHIFSGNLGYKICIGLNQESGGGWNEADSLLINNPDLIRSTLFERVFQNGNILHMFQKVMYQFGSYVYPWILDIEGHPEFSDVICRRAVSAYMIAVSALASVKLFRDSQSRLKLFPVFVIIFGYMAVFSIIEVQARYNYVVIPLLTVLASDIQIKKTKRVKK